MFKNKLEWFKLAENNEWLSHTYKKVDSIKEKLIRLNNYNIKEVTRKTVSYILDDIIDDLVNEYKLTLASEFNFIYDNDEKIWQIFKINWNTRWVIIPSKDWSIEPDENPDFKKYSKWFNQLNSLMKELIFQEKYLDSIQYAIACSDIRQILDKQKSLWYYIVEWEEVQTLEKNLNRISKKQFIHIASTFYVYQYLNSIKLKYINTLQPFLKWYSPITSQIKDY